MRQYSCPAGSSVTFFSASGLTTNAGCAIAVDSHKHDTEVRTAITPLEIRGMRTPPRSPEQLSMTLWHGEGSRGMRPFPDQLPRYAPPLTCSVWPVVKRPPGPASHTTALAISSTLPRRPSKVL